MSPPQFHIWAVISATAGLEGSIFLSKTETLEIQICYTLFQVIGPSLDTMAFHTHYENIFSTLSWQTLQTVKSTHAVDHNYLQLFAIHPLDGSYSLITSAQSLVECEFATTHHKSLFNNKNTSLCHSFPLFLLPSFQQVIYSCIWLLPTKLQSKKYGQHTSASLLQRKEQSKLPVPHPDHLNPSPRQPLLALERKKEHVTGGFYVLEYLYNYETRV